MQRRPWYLRLATIAAGLVIVLIGIVLIPLPGPGWLTVFAGLSLLGREVPMAQRAARRLRSAGRRVDD